MSEKKEILAFHWDMQNIRYMQIIIQNLRVVPMQLFMKLS